MTLEVYVLVGLCFGIVSMRHVQKTIIDDRDYLKAVEKVKPLIQSRPVPFYIFCFLFDLVAWPLSVSMSALTFIAKK